jgi:hypothetical protein
MEFTNANTIIQIFLTLNSYKTNTFDCHLEFFKTSTAELKNKIKEEIKHRKKNQRKLNSPLFPNESINKDCTDWFKEYLLVNQSAHLLYYGTATTDEEKLFFLENFSTKKDLKEFKTIAHPKVYYYYDPTDRDDSYLKKPGAVYQKHLFPLCCYCIAFFIDDLIFRAEEKSILIKSMELTLPALPADGAKSFKMNKFSDEVFALQQLLNEDFTNLHKMVDEVYSLIDEMYAADTVGYIDFENDFFNITDLYETNYPMENLSLFPRLVVVDKKTGATETKSEKNVYRIPDISTRIELKKNLKFQHYFTEESAKTKRKEIQAARTQATVEIQVIFCFIIIIIIIIIILFLFLFLE